MAGRGIVGTLDGEQVALGSPAFIAELLGIAGSIGESLAERARTVVAVSQGGALVGVLGWPTNSARARVRRCRACGPAGSGW